MCPNTVDTIMSPMLAKLFVLHVFSKHGVPSHVTIITHLFCPPNILIYLDTCPHLICAVHQIWMACYISLTQTQLTLINKFFHWFHKSSLSPLSIIPRVCKWAYRSKAHLYITLINSCAGLGTSIKDWGRPGPIKALLCIFLELDPSLTLFPLFHVRINF